MKVSGNSLRPGNVILHQNRIWAVSKTQHTQPGKGGAYMCVTLRDIKDGTKKDERFRSAEEVHRLFIEEEAHTFLYAEGDTFTFMHCETYEQIFLSQDLFNASKEFLQPNLEVKVGFYEQVPIFVYFPEHVVLTVEEADPVVKGQTASSSYKSARLSNGMKTLVPPYIESGTKIIVSTQDGAYVERHKA